MLVAIANQKGGVGKTTIAILFSNYLFEKEREFIAVDFDFQESFYSKWEEEKEAREEDPPYEVLQISLEDSSKVIELENMNNDELFLLDLPGKIDDDNLIPILKNLDFVIVPFSYDKLTFQSTLYFCQVIKAVNENLQIIFVPNKVKSTVKYTTKEQVSEILKNYGVMAPQITDRISIQRLSVYKNSKDVEELCDKTFHFITDKIWQKV